MYKLLSLKRYSGLRADSILVGFYFFEMKILGKILPFVLEKPKELKHGTDRREGFRMR